MSKRANQLIQNSRAGSLGTVDQDGNPFVSLVTIAAIGPTRLVMLLSGLAQHTKNITTHARCSLLLVEPGGESGDPLAGARLTVRGDVSKLDGDTDARASFLSQHPSASMYVDFADFSFYQLEIADAYLVAGFGKIETIPGSRLAVVSEG